MSQFGEMKSFIPENGKGMDWCIYGLVLEKEEESVEEVANPEAEVDLDFKDKTLKKPRLWTVIVAFKLNFYIFKFSINFP